MLIKEILSKGGYSNITLAESAEEAYGHLGMNSPTIVTPDIDIILMDILMPKINGIEACYRIKSVEALRDIPIVMVTALDETESLQMAFGGGAIDYIIKPVNKIELLARVRSILRLKHEMDRRKSREKELLELTKQLESANRVLQSFSSLDGLTSIANRQFFDGFFDREWIRAKRYDHPISLIIADIDNFKLYNDEYGHQAGDFLLQRIARGLSEMERKSGDLIARYGGEEFAILISGAGVDEAREVGEKARSLVENLKIPHAGSKISEFVTISVGAVSTLPEGDASSTMLFKAAEDALAKAKNDGRNRVVAIRL